MVVWLACQFTLTIIIFCTGCYDAVKTSIYLALEPCTFTMDIYMRFPVGTAHLTVVGIVFTRTVIT